MLRNLLRRFGYVKLNSEDQYALAKHYASQMVQVMSQEKERHIEYLKIDGLSSRLAFNPDSKTHLTYTCDQPDEK